MSNVVKFPADRAAPARPEEATGLVLHMPAPNHYTVPASHFGFAEAVGICYKDGDYHVVDLPTWFS